VEEAAPVNEPDLDRMTRDEAIAWFDGTDTLVSAIRSMTPATDPAPDPAPDMPMAMVSIRLPVPLVEQLDALAGRAGARRSDVVREALARYVADQTAQVGRSEAEWALEVLRRVIVARTQGVAEAA
jgi:Arc/MetJ-type ribon-helix-helix transcriptional regulator